MNEEDIKQTIANNIVHYRKVLNFTQAELAEKLNYSDKAVSKWERAESMPDVVLLRQLADLFGISLDKLTSVHAYKRVVNIDRRKKKFIIPLLSAGLVWVLVTLVYACLYLFGAEWDASWLLFIYAVPLSFIVLMIFNFIWGIDYLSPIIVSIVSWTIATSLFLSVNIPYNYMIFVIVVPIQVLVVLWYIMRLKPKRKK